MCKKIIARHEKDTYLNESEDEMDEESEENEFELLIDKIYADNKKHLAASSEVFSVFSGNFIIY